jgi:hypothetical protein
MTIETVVDRAAGLDIAKASRWPASGFRSPTVGAGEQAEVLHDDRRCVRPRAGSPTTR